MSVFDPKSLQKLNKNTVLLVVNDFEVMRKVHVNQLRQLGALAGRLKAARGRTA